MIRSTEALGRLRLMQLVSPTLPVGGFTYSQGLEWAVEAGWVNDELSLVDWLTGLIHDNLGQLDLPIVKRLYLACQAGNEAELRHWCEYLYASRETRELRDEERHRAHAMTTLLVDLGVDNAALWRSTLRLCQAAPYALAAWNWKIAATDAALGYGFSWLENQTTTAVKLIPLGQTAGQRVQLRLAELLAEVTKDALRLPDEMIGACAPAQAIASSQHETQYTRLFRS
ncbi:MAG: urease accessory protein UreF [Gammaproteobacteria bacterium]